MRAKLPSFTAFRRAFTRLWITTAPKPKASPLSNLYQACNECPLDVFIDCLVDGKLERLVKSGKASQKELVEAWEKIFIEYCDLSGESNIKRLIYLSKNIGYLRSRIIAIQLCVYVLSTKKSDSCIDQLKNMGFNMNFSDESMLEDLKKVIAASKSHELELTIKSTEYEKMVNQGEKAKIKSSYFDNLLIDLSRFMGYRIKKNELTVNEFIIIKKKYRKEMELLGNNPHHKVGKSKYHQPSVPR